MNTKFCAKIRSFLENIHILVFWVEGYQHLEGVYSFHLQEILCLIYCRLRQYIPWKHWYQPTRLHTIITKNNTICSASPLQHKLQMSSTTHVSLNHTTVIIKKATEHCKHAMLQLEKYAIFVLEIITMPRKIILKKEQHFTFVISV